MGKDLNVKFGASLVIVVMLMASIVGFIGIGTAATEDKDSNEATGPIMISKDNLRKVEITTPEPLVPRVYPTITKTVGDPYPSPQAFPFQDADTTRCVLNELYATMDYGGLLPAIKGAYNDLDNGMYTTSEAFFMEWHADMEQILTPPPPPWNDTEYDPGHYMFVPPWSDSCARLLQPPPLGLDMTLWQILTGAGEYVPVPSAAVDGEIYEYPTIWYQDALEDTSAGSVGEVRRDDIVAMITPRLATETPVTIAVNGTFDDVTDWGNMTVTVAAIGDLPTTNIVVDFFIAEEHNSEIEVRNNPLTGNPPSEAWSNKNYYMNKVGRRWAGMGEPNAGGSFFLFNKTDTVTYVDVPFDDHWQWGGASMGWIGNNLWLLGVVINGDTGEVLQTSAFSIGNPTPDLYMTPVDIYTPTIGTVVNETAHGPTFDGEIGPIDLDNGNIIDCTLYIDLAGSEWLLLSEGADYFLDYATGIIDTSPIEPFEAGWIFHAFYNYTLPPPNDGDIQPFDIRVSNTGNAAAGASTLEITNGDGGPLVDTVAVPALAAGESWDGNWNFDTTGYPGFLTLCFIPDGPDAIAESDENNNIAPFDLYVAPPIDVGVASIDSHADGGTYEWGGTTILATVRNYGSAAQGPFNVQCTVMEGATTILQEIKPTTGILNQDESEQLFWNTNLNSIAAYDITIETQLGPDTIPANDIMTITINTQNTIPPAEATHLRVWPAGGATIYNNYTVDQDNPDHGVVTNTYTNVINPPDALTEDIQEVMAGGGTVWLNIFTETFPNVDGNWRGDDFPDTAQDEWWFVDEAVADLTDIRIGAYDTPPGPPNSVQYRDCDQDWAGQYMEGYYNGAQNWFDLTSYTDGYLNFSNMGAVNANNEGWRLEITRNGGGDGWSTMPFVEDTAALATHGWQTYSYQYVAADLAATQWGFRVNCAGSGPGDISTFDDFTIDVGTSGAPAYTLEHRWRTEDISVGSTTLDLYVTAMTNGGSDDSFSFGYSTVVGGPYTSVLTVPAGLAMATYSGALPAAFSGQFYLNVIDDNTGDAVQQDTAYVDTIRIEQSIVPGGGSNQVAIQDIPVEGTVTPPANGYLETTSIPPDGSAEQIEEALTGGAGPREYISGHPFPYDMTTGFPAGWTEYDAGGSAGANTWIGPVDCSDNGLPIPALGDDLVLWMNWEIPYNNKALETEPYDFTIYTAVELNFEHFMNGAWGDVLSIEWDNTGGGPGGTWNFITSWTADGSSTNWNIRANIDCSAVDGLNNVRFRFRYEAADGNSNGVDYVEITGVPDTSQASLEHTWRMQDFAGPSLSRTLEVTARTNVGSDDGFTFGYSTDSAGPFTPVITVPSTQSTFATYSASIPAGITGEFYINVVDTNTLDATLDSVYVDMIRIEIFGSPDVNDCTIRWDLSADDGAGYNDVTTYDIYRSDSADGTYYEGPYIFVDSVAAGTQVWADVGEGLDPVDNIWYYVVANDPVFTSPPTGIISKLDVLPETYNVMADGVSPLTIPIGTPSITLTAQLRDNTTADEWDAFISAADWFDPLSTDGGNIVTPDDGTWDGPLEGVTVVIDTSAWSGGDHVIEVRGNSPNGWGPVATVTVTVTAPPYDIDLTGVAANTWVLVSFPIEATGDVLTVFDDAAWGDGGTTWDYIQWYDNLNKEWKSYSIYKPASLNDMDVIDNTFGFWIHITGNVGDLQLTIGSGGMPAGPVLINLYTGWNLVGYPSATPRAGDVTLPAEADLVSVYDLAEPYRIRDELKGAVTFTEGNAYWVRVTNDCVWTVNP